MPLFRCETCNCVENTATSNYHTRRFDVANETVVKRNPLPPALCSACDPQIGQWHGLFTQRSADGMLVGHDGYLWHQEEFDKGWVHHTTPRGRIVDGKEVPL